MFRKSLTLRIILMSSFWIALGLVLTAVLLMFYYREHIARHYDAHVHAQLEQMIGAVRLTPEGQIQLDRYPSDPNFDIRHSGWYWEIRRHDRVVMRSHSLGTDSLDLGGVQANEVSHVHLVRGPAQEPLRLQTLEVPAGAAGEHAVLVATAPVLRINEDVTDIAEHMLASFIVLGATLILGVIIQVRVALRPLHAVSEGISQIREGRAEQLQGTFPREVQPLVTELNNLVEHIAVLLKRARNQLGDLAHSIKNPLTVINNEVGDLDEAKRVIILKETGDIVASVDHYLKRARIFGKENVLGARTLVKPVAEDMAFLMQRLNSKRDLEFDLSGLGNCWFRGEAQDLEEILGNLLDNACKWAKSRVYIHCQANLQRLRIAIEDDGPGIPELETELVLRQGGQLDDSLPGHGRGLGIVQDILALYGGNLTLRRSSLGGLCAELDLPGG